jgi:cytoskeletal protein CcmA (bactofilin family)
MFFKTNRPSNGIGSLIGAGTRIEGDVFFGGGLRLDGSVHGKVCVLPGQSGTLVVGQTGRIDGEVVVPNLVLNGTVNGKVAESEMLEIQSTARVSGDVYYRFISVRQGAIVEGLLVHRDDLKVT